MADDIEIVFNHFDALLERMLRNVDRIVDQTAHAIADDAKGTVAMHTGADKASIYVVSKLSDTYGEAVAEAQGANPKSTVLPKVEDPKDGEAFIAVAEDYGAFIEYGTSHMSARPYLTPAAEARRSFLLDKLSEGLFDE